jgi:hypothetical protein
MCISWRALFLGLGLIGAFVGLTACDGAAPSASALLPAQIAASRSATLPDVRPRELLYATTLDWNTGSGSVYFYDAYGKASALGSLGFSRGYPDGVWTDGEGNVYVAVVNAGSDGRGYINVYAPKLRKLLRTYAAGLDGPSGGAFDSAGNMYVSNLCGAAPSESCYVFARTRHGHSHIVKQSGSTTGYVAIYPPGQMQPSSYLQSPINIAVGIALDRSANVFVVNNTGGIAWDVIEFPAGSTSGKIVPFRNLPKSRWVGADTFDQTGALVISVNSAIDFFPHERGKPARSLTNGIVAADGLAYGPDGTLFAGNYEFESNEGNIVAFPPGASAPARTFAVPYNNGVVSVAVGRSARGR